MKTLMNTLMAALVAVVLLTAQLYSPVSAASSCGETYTVQANDYLAQIAKTCGVSFSEILALNPQITNANLIYTGQILRLEGSAPTSYWPTYYSPYYPIYPASSGYARVSLSTIRASVGDALTVAVSGFPANTQIDYRLGLVNEDYSRIYDSATDASGNSSVTISIPADASAGDYWVVKVVTTSGSESVAVNSQWIYITSSAAVTSSGSARISLSTTEAAAGESITVKISGFPANADVDYRVMKRGESYTSVYDGTVDADGNDSISISLPSSAAEGEYWMVQVATTSQVEVTTVNSHSIYITD